MSAENFSKFGLPLLGVCEGGNWDDPRAGLTSRGITQASYNEYRTLHSLALQAVTRATDAELRTLLKELYWDQAKCDGMPYPWDVAIFVEGVNTGPSETVKLAQRAFGVTVDGVCGAETLAAMNGKTDLEDFLVECLRYYEALAVPADEAGWGRRLFRICKFLALP